MHILRNESLARHNTLRLPGKAAAFLAIDVVDQLSSALEWSRNAGLPMLSLGEGSNIVLAGDVNALMLKVMLRGVEVLEHSGERVLLRVQAGENWHQFVQWTLTQGYFGLENLALIPGAVGAAPVQNIGAYGVEISEFLHAVHIFDVEGGTFSTLDAADCAFSYRDSIFKTTLLDKVVITALDISLSTREDLRIDYPALSTYFSDSSQSALTAQSVFDAVVAIRSSKLPDPALTPNVGSFFKNPIVSTTRAQALKQAFPQLPCYQQDDGRVKLSAAWMIEHCGWKGRQRNSVAVHDKHALVLINLGNASGAALLEFAGDIAADVADRFAVELAIEPRVYGD